MRLYLVRHAGACDKAVDPERHLTEKGHADAKALATSIARLQLTVHAIWHSGLARALQTAEAMALAVESVQGLVEHCGLDSEDPVKPIAKEIEQINQDLMIVGHEPFLSKLASRLVTGKKKLDLVDLDKPSILCLDDHGARQWKIQWLLNPEALLVLGATSSLPPVETNLSSSPSPSP